MPTTHGAMLASRVSTCPRDHFWRSAIAPRGSRPTTWKEFLPMPITAIVILHFSAMDLLLVFGAPRQLQSPAGQEHGRTIPLTDILGRCEFFPPLTEADNAQHRPTSPSADDKWIT